MKACSIISLLFAAAILATVPISPRVTTRGLELSVDEAKAITYGHYRRVHRGCTEVCCYKHRRKGEACTS
jgi:hypothetical protein